jgi:hypothetical protein
MDERWIDDWVRRGEELATRHADGNADAAAGVGELVRRARMAAEGMPEGAKLMESVSGRLRTASVAPSREGGGRPKVLAELALAFSRAAGEIAGSPT